ncbi:MAG: translation elongation factor Ts [Dehalococcoidia bacterium]|nr:translation elongation factor Ts [Dehalococcoidia bacterium]
MAISTEVIKEVRERTNAGILDCKNALLKANGDIEKAIENLKNRGLVIAEKKAARITNKGIIETYIHHTGQIGVLIEINCETDFVAHTDEFKQLAHDLAMQVAAAHAQFVTVEEIPEDVELDPKEVCLLLQPFVKNPDRSVEEVIAETIGKVGENIKVRRFVRFELGD